MEENGRGRTWTISNRQEENSFRTPLAALGAFLQAVDQGTIKAGSYLLVESLDRLSRQDVWKAFGQFRDIITRGINIVTLQDERTYSADQGEMGFTDLMISLSVMQRAHEESLTKSRRLSAAWTAKRDKAKVGLKKLTAQCPAWLELSDDKTSFTVLEDRAAVIERIFKMTIDGIGKGVIARQFNTEGVTTFGRSKGWHPSYIQKILDSEAVIGIFQPHTKKTINGKQVRTPEGDPIDGYFPAVIKPEVFYKAKQVKASRIIVGANIGKSFSNLFTGMAFCGSCGAPMHFENKGRGTKGGTYLVCSDARRKVGDCQRHGWRYPEAQCHIISNLLDLDYRELFPKVYKRLSNELERLEGLLLEREGELQRTDESIDRITTLLIERDSSKALLNKLDALELKKENLTSELEDLRKQVDQEKDRSASLGLDFQSAERAMNETIRIEREGSPEDVLEVRRKLHQLLKKVVDRIVFTPCATSGQQQHHGTITIHYKDVVDSYLSIKVGGRAQKDSVGFRVDSDGQQVEHVHVVDAQWPPVDRFVSGAALWNLIKK
ncbi:recombinase family protein [uncultured Desulfosarcina sp.]|uniref:recombinase family protein n=1 Tax=uncultured Desulfosarcina sp. TaxID=218289 RepID=UPI0029C7F7F1|nr:recombinase family protein [uncultured Desulfosarcina sp.]